MRVRHAFGVAAVGLVTIAFSSGAQATTITETFQGTMTSSSSLFNGRSYTAIYTINSNLGSDFPANNSSTAVSPGSVVNAVSPITGFGISGSGSSSPVSAVFTISGISNYYDISGNALGAAYGATGHSTTHIGAYSADTITLANGDTATRSVLNIADFPDAATYLQGLPNNSSFNQTENAPKAFTGELELVVTDPTGAVVGMTTANLSVDSVSVSAVPLPGALPMFGAALVGLGGLAKRRAKKAA